MTKKILFFLFIPLVLFSCSTSPEIAGVWKRAYIINIPNQPSISTEETTYIYSDGYGKIEARWMVPNWFKWTLSEDSVLELRIYDMTDKQIQYKKYKVVKVTKDRLVLYNYLLKEIQPNEKISEAPKEHKQYE